MTIHVELSATAVLKNQQKACHHENKSSTKLTLSKQYTKHKDHYTVCVKKMDDLYKNPGDFQQKEPDSVHYGWGSTLIDWLICSPVWDLCLGPEELEFSELKDSLYLNGFEKQKGGHQRKTLTYMLKTACGKVWKKAKHFFGPTVLLALTFSFIQGLLLMIVFEVIAYYLLPHTYKLIISVLCLALFDTAKKILVHNIWQQLTVCIYIYITASISLWKYQLFLFHFFFNKPVDFVTDVSTADGHSLWKWWLQLRWQWSWNIYTDCSCNWIPLPGKNFPL